MEESTKEEIKKKKRPENEQGVQGVLVNILAHCYSCAVLFFYRELFCFQVTFSLLWNMTF